MIAAIFGTKHIIAYVIVVVVVVGLFTMRMRGRRS
jgi:hypothetical protein